MHSKLEVASTASIVKTGVRKACNLDNIEKPYVEEGTIWILSFEK